MKFLIIGLTSLFLISCGKSGDLSATKKDANTMKLSKENDHSGHNHDENNHSDNQALDAKTTRTYTDTKSTAPKFDTGLRPSNSK
jgi:hypothetical protein